MSDSSSKVLIEAARLVELGWTQGAHARTKDGNGCAPTRRDAVCWCATGSVWRAAVRLYGTRSFLVEREAMRRLRSIVLPKFPEGVVAWNDRRGRTGGELVDPKPDDATHGNGVIGVTSHEMLAVLWDAGRRTLYLAFPRDPDEVPDANWFDRTGRDMPVLDGPYRVGLHLDSGRLAILGVDSLRHKGGLHWIVANGHDLFDPAPGDGPRYESVSQFSRSNPMKVAEAILIEAAKP